MGVPKFYRWLSERFPQINTVISDSTLLPEFDNMYLDMNGIIHACTHPNDNDLSNSLTMRDMMLAIFRYIDRMVSEIARPRKVLFMAIDGCAPRAKLNQQRARRFRSAQDQVAAITKARDAGENVDFDNLFDSNCITPGTEFMEQVGLHLKWFIRKKIKEDPIWQGLEVVFSGHDVPGEGEHKIMQFIRELRARPDYKPNQRHCMYGADADLIMLGLATHEPHFTLLREVVNFNFRGPGGPKQTVVRQTKEAQFQLLHLSILREYVELDLGSGIGRTLDKERLVDDFIFLTFLVGNDFLPHLPTLDISEQAFDVIFDAYKAILKSSQGYLVENGELSDMVRLEALFAAVGSQEADILAEREMTNKKQKKRFNNRGPSKEEAAALEDEESDRQAAYEQAMIDAFAEGAEVEPLPEANPYLTVRSNRAGAGEEGDNDEPLPTTAKDYRGRYYYDKFKIIPDARDAQTTSFLNELCTHYLEGLQWCIAYYIKGCVSWTWYYPYNYGPMLIDMVGCQAKNEKIKFDLGAPFTPFQQLLGCLPPASSRLLPKPYQYLMLNDASPVKHFYPLDFGVDQDGKKNPWEAVVLLPFIDEKELMSAEKSLCDPGKLSGPERRRNDFGSILLYHYEPTETGTYLSCNPSIGLEDLKQCNSKCINITPNHGPGAAFLPKLVEGTKIPAPGFPSLGVLRVASVTTSAIKLNVFGSDSRYRTMHMKLATTKYDPATLDLGKLIGRSVYVNYPNMHEALVVAASDKDQEFRYMKSKDQKALEKQGAKVKPGTIIAAPHDGVEKEKWHSIASNESHKYHKGCGVPGMGGLDIGQVEVLLKVVPLQGMKKDPVTGAKKKSFGTIEAIVPIQVTLLTPVVIDERFVETTGAPVHDLFPHGCVVVGINKQFHGVKGKVVGPHTESAPGPDPTDRTVEVEFNLTPPEPNFSSILATSMQDRYYPAHEMAKSLGISGGTLGKIVGAVFSGNDRFNIGLDLKRNGQYYLLGFARAVDGAVAKSAAKLDKAQQNVWARSDAITVVGSGVKAENKEGEEEGPRQQWEYSTRTLHLILEYKSLFPTVFSAIDKNPAEKKFSASMLFKTKTDEMYGRLQDWINSHPALKQPRTPLSTTGLSNDVINGIERAVEARGAYLKSSGSEKIRVTKVPLDSIMRGGAADASDMPVNLNTQPPSLGDRVVNLSSLGVPFGLKGTVVTIHTSTGFVEVLFDDEFTGGRPVQGSSSKFRGRLCPWRGVLLLGKEGTTSMDLNKMTLKNKQSTTAAGGAGASSKTAAAPAGGAAMPPAPPSAGRSALMQAALEGSTALPQAPPTVDMDGVVQYLPMKGKQFPPKSGQAPATTGKGNALARGGAKPAAADSAPKTAALKPAALMKKKKAAASNSA
jgi:5'-3' exoribonuclease 1